jgi:hypothetical protein
MFADIIRYKLASLYELGTTYSYIDALNMAEILTVNSYNIWLSQIEGDGRNRLNR